MGNLQEVAQHASSLSDPEERQLLLANVLEEISGRELRVATDAVTSRLLEALLAGAPGAQLMQFLQAFTNEDMMFQLAGGAFGSHVAEKVLAGLHQQAEELIAAEAEDGTAAAAAAAAEDAEDGNAAAAAGTLEALLGSMVGAIGGHLFDYIMDKHATHVARALLVVIAGRDVLSPVAKKKQHQHQQHGEGEEGQEAAAEGRKANQQAFKPGRSSLQQKMEGNTPAAAAAAGQQQQGVRFPALLRRFAKMLPLYDAANMQLLGKNNYSGPFIQAVLRAAAGDKDLLQLLLPPILGVDAAKAAAAAPGEILATLTDSHVGRLLRDECYSHLLEVVAAVMPNELRSEFFSRFLKGRLQPLANHHSANFVVQAWMASCSTPQQVQEVISELQVHLPDLLKRRRSGVAAALVAAAGRAGGPAQQAAAVAALSAALSALPQWQGREGTDHLAPALLTLDSNAVMGASSTTPQQQQQYNSHYGYGGGGSRLSTPGSAILATLLTHYNKKAAKPFAASVAALSAADAARAAKDPAGSRALQAFVEGGVAGAAAKGSLLGKLSGCWGDVALQAAGSFFLEKAYAWADLDQKEAIVKEVAGRQSALMAGCHWGPLLARKLALDSYLRSPEEWRKRAASTAAAKRAFEQLLSDDTPAAAAGGSGDGYEDAAGAGKKRRRQQQQQQQQADETGVAAAAAGDGSSRKKEKKRAKLAAAAAEEAAGGGAAAAAAAAAEPAGDVEKKKKKRKRTEGGNVAAAAAADASPDAEAVKPKKKKKKDKSTDATATAAAASGVDSKSKRKRQGVGEAAAAVAGSTDDFVALLGFGGLGADSEQKQSGKRHKKA